QGRCQSAVFHFRRWACLTRRVRPAQQPESRQTLFRGDFQGTFLLLPYSTGQIIPRPYRPNKKTVFRLQKPETVCFPKPLVFRVKNPPGFLSISLLVKQLNKTKKAGL